VPGVLANVLASVGPFTRVFEQLATSIGSGLVVGSFVAGLSSFVWSGSRKHSEGWGVIGGYLGGVAALGLLVLDIVGKRFVF
jgi:hypothetical protein